MVIVHHKSLMDCVQCNGGLKNAVESVGARLKRKLWVGTLGVNTDGFRDSLRRNIEWRMRDDCDSLPVWIPDSEFAGCYDDFCHQVRAIFLLRVANT